jgi:hypothetical protein
MKVTDKSKIFDVKGHIEGKLGTAALAVEVEADGSMKKENLDKLTETTIAVNWSGGGSIKDPEKDWTIDTLVKVASGFPDLVAITPQRIYAILTKYSALESFHRQVQKYTMLEYENASIYTNSLLDHFMDYKMMWKLLSQATIEVENNRAKMYFSQLTEDTANLAMVKPLSSDQFGEKLQDLGNAGGATITRGDLIKKGISQLDSAQNTPAQPSQGSDAKLTPAAETEPEKQKRQEKEWKALATQVLDGGKLISITNPWKYGDDKSENRIQYEPFKNTFAGLITARKVCRFEMAKIVNEVDLITRNPKIALETSRDAHFLHPLIFKQLLPVSSFFVLRSYHN